uniref:Uncharacterized protein n=1 Tax=Anguilla anguilla TaxID=7936 RepID=A0A0E9RZ38_ANGAN
MRRLSGWQTAGCPIGSGSPGLRTSSRDHQKSPVYTAYLALCLRSMTSHPRPRSHSRPDSAESVCA